MLANRVILIYEIKGCFVLILPSFIHPLLLPYMLPLPQSSITFIHAGFHFSVRKFHSNQGLLLQDAESPETTLKTAKIEVSESVFQS